MKRFYFCLILMLTLIVGFSCTDPLPPKINPYDVLRSNWFFIPRQLKNDTLITSIEPGYFTNPITIAPYLVNEWDEWIVDTTYTNIRIKITLVNNPDVFQEFIIEDTTAEVKRLVRGDSLWRTMEWNQRLNGKRVYQYLPPPHPNPEKQRMEYDVARIRLEGTIQLFKNILPIPLTPKEILIFYWFKMT
ncbi:MAG: hypothetical protein Kow0042_10070 [Calditrichia bacterium]